MPEEMTLARLTALHDQYMNERITAERATRVEPFDYLTDNSSWFLPPTAQHQAQTLVLPPSLEEVAARILGDIEADGIPQFSTSHTEPKPGTVKRSEKRRLLNFRNFLKYKGAL